MKSNIIIEAAVANHGGATDAGNRFPNWLSPKNQSSRGFLNYLIVAAIVVAAAFASCEEKDNQTCDECEQCRECEQCTECEQCRECEQCTECEECEECDGEHCEECETCDEYTASHSLYQLYSFFK